ncbi:MAG: TonB-dependent receptor [Ignavibacteriales bacterium]|nr:TonB-dependent receptor [Ignavibacteriales bacterium]
MKTRILLCIFFFSKFLYAQEDATKQNVSKNDSLKNFIIEETVVTGTRTTKKIIDVPYSVQRVDERDFKFEKKTSVSDVLSVVPGLFLQDRYGNHDVRISMRGFGSRSNSGIRGVRILLDGIPESEPDGQTRIEAIDFHSLGSIEVVKGNSSSLYTNAPGGVINFLNDVRFDNSSIVLYNEVGSYNAKRKGMKAAFRSDNYRFLTSYSTYSSTGYREHSNDDWRIFNSVLEINPRDFTKFFVYSYYVAGAIKLPGSLTRSQLDGDPVQGNTRDVGRDAKRVTKKGRIGLRFNTFFGEEKNNELDITAYGTIKYFERTARTYRILNRYGVGSAARYIHKSELFGHANEFSIGNDFFYQTGPIEEYGNIGGIRTDELKGVTNEDIGNIGWYLQNTFTIVKEKLDVMLTGRFDNVSFKAENQFQVKKSTRDFQAFTPKLALNYKWTPMIAAYASYGLGFDTPAANELDNYPTSSLPVQLHNPDLQPQKSKNIEVGLKGNIFLRQNLFFKTNSFEVTMFNTIINDEIVPFEDAGAVFFRNAATTNRTGIELGLNTEIIKGLQWKSAYTYSHFSYDRYIARFIDDTGATSEKSFAKNVVPSVPKHNLTLSLSYEQNITEAVTGFVKGNYLGISGMFTDDENSEYAKAYQLFNTTLGCEARFGKFNVLLSGGMNNVFDENYVAFININSTAKEFYEAGMPRNFFGGITLGYQL